MAGILFIVNVPKKEYENHLREFSNPNLIIEKEKVPKVIDEFKEKQLETKNFNECKSKNSLNQHRDVNSETGKFNSESIPVDGYPNNRKIVVWDEIKQALKPNKNKLKISRPVRSVDVLGAFRRDTPLETILQEIVSRLDIKNAVWNSTRGEKFWQVTFSIESGNLSEELLQVLRTFGIGSRHQSSVSLLPCALYYKSDDRIPTTTEIEDAVQESGSNTAWSRFSTSVRARTNLAQVLHDVRANGTLTFDWVFMLVVAAFVAAIGLIENSTVVLVASMLISPLMGPITTGTLGTAVRDRSLQLMGVKNEFLGLFLVLVVGFLTGLVICGLDELYGVVEEWPTGEMLARSEHRSLWIGILVAIPSGAGCALAVLGDYTASLVGVAISASLLPPAVNAGLLWSMALTRLVVKSEKQHWLVTQPSELALLGTASLCLTLVNIVCIFLSGVAVYKVKEVSPLERRDISWWRANKDRFNATRQQNKEESLNWDAYTQWCTNSLERKENQNSMEKEKESNRPCPLHGQTVTFRKETALMKKLREHNLETYCHKLQLEDNYIPLNSQMNADLEKQIGILTKNSKLQNADEENPMKSMEEPVANNVNSGYYNFAYHNDDSKPNSEAPTLEPSLNVTVDKISQSSFNPWTIKVKMPGGVVFVIYIPSSNYEHILRFGKPKDLIVINDTAIKPGRLAVELRNKKIKHIPIHINENYYNDGFNRNLENISEYEEFLTMENILQELLSKLHVEHVVWISDKAGNYFEIIFPLPTGDQCETMLHCLTQLGIGVQCKSIVSVLPCNVVHSAVKNEEYDEDTRIRKSEDAKRWRNFVESIRSKLTVKQVVDGVRGGGELSFDYLTLIITADSLAALGLVENNASNIVAAMLVSPLMGPVMSITFGTIISDRRLVRSGFESLVIGMLASLVFGFIFGLILGTTEMPWGFGDWPTEEMKGRGNVRSLWMGVLWALTSGTGVALALLQGSAGPLIGIAISASLLPPVVNCGLYWALACIWLLYPGVKIPHLKGEPYTGNSSYQPLYHDYLPIEFAVNGIVSCCLTIVNVICIFITAILFLKIKEVAAPYTSSPDLRRFWEQDIKVARESNRANLQKAEDDERAELVLEDLNRDTDETIKDKLEAAVEEALDDDTYRKVKRMSYQSHIADEVMHSIGLSRTPVSVRSSQINSGVNTPTHPKGSNVDDIARLDKVLTSLLGLKEAKRGRSFISHRCSPRASRIPRIVEEITHGHSRRSESWPERIFEDSVVRSVISNLRDSKRKSQLEEPFLTPN